MQILRIAGILGPDSPMVLEGGRIFDPDNVYYGPLLQGINEAFDGKARLDVVQVGPADYMDVLSAGKYDGLLIMSTEFVELPALHALAHSAAPFVAIGVCPDPTFADLPTVDCANREGGQAAARHLIDLGHRNLACVNLAGDHMDHCERYYGFIDAAAAAGCQIDGERCLLHPGYEYERFTDLVDSWLNRMERLSVLPTAIFACDYNMAEAIMRVLQRRDIAIPGSISVMGFDDPPAAASLAPPLTTMRQPVYEMGFQAATRLLMTLTHPSMAQSTLGSERLPVEIVMRGSVSGPRDAGTIRTR